MSRLGAAPRRPGGPTRWARVVLALLAVAVPLPGLAGQEGSPYPYGGVFHERLDELFFSADHGPGALADPAKLAAYEAFIRSKLDWVQHHVANQEIHDDGKSEAKAWKTARETDVAIALEQIQRWLAELAAAPDTATAHGLAADIVTLEYATRSFSEPLESIKIPIHLKNMVFEWRAPKETRASRAEREATNLLDPDSGSFYTPDQLAALTRAGGDVSLLDPPAQTPFWRRQEDISRVDVVANYLEGGHAIHQDIRHEMPSFDGAVFELRKVHRTQTKPKLDVWYRSPECARKSRKKQKKCRQKVKLKFGMETHADPPANALLAAFGYNVDVSVHLKNVRVYLGDMSLEELEKEWIGYFDRQRIHTYIPIESVMTARGEDERGSFVVFQEAVAELKPDEVVRIGPFPFSSGIASQHREARALFLYNVWIGNADMKDEGNNKVVLRMDGDGDYRMYMIQQDLGHAMGFVLPERPEIFPWDLVEDHAFARVFGAVNGSIEFDYVDLQDNGLSEHATFADMRWMARMIASLTRDQISAAVDLGVWPGGIGQLYIEKLINRRNQLVVAFQLEDEFAPLPVDRQLTTPDGSVVDGHLVVKRYPDESPINYGDHHADIMDPVFQFLRDGLVSGVQAGVGAIDVINPGDIEIGSRAAILPRVLFELSRKVLLNPSPEGAFDQYIVVDTMALGLRVGVGYVGSVEGAWMKRVTLAYPVPTYRRGLYGGIGAANFLRRKEKRFAALPDRYVLYREELTDRGARLSSDGTSALNPLGIQGSQGWVTTHRSVLDHRGEDPILWIDEPRTLQRRIQFYLEFFDVLQFPFMESGTEQGHLEGRVLRLDGDKLGELDENGERIFDAVLQRGDFSRAERLLASEPTHTRADFARRGSWLSLVFLNWQNRASEEAITQQSPGGRTLSIEHQTERRARFSWWFVDNGESQQLRVGGSLQGEGRAGEVLDAPTVVLQFDVDDKNAHSDEFDSYYHLLAGLGAGQTYLPPGFVARDWEIGGKPSGRWSRLLTTGTVELHRQALEALMHLDEETHWRILAASLGLSAHAMDECLRSADPSGPLQLRSRRPRDMRARLLIRRSRTVFSLLERARQTEPGEARLKLLVEALYRANFRSGDTYDPTLLAALLRQAGARRLADAGALFVEGRITRAFEDEQNLPERRDIVGALGTPGEAPRTQYNFFPFTGLELYNMLNWTRELD